MRAISPFVIFTVFDVSQNARIETVIATAACAAFVTLCVVEENYVIFFLSANLTCLNK